MSSKVHALSKTLAPVPSTLTLSALMLSPLAFGAEAPATGDTKPAEDGGELKKVVVQGQADRNLSSPKQVKPLVDTPQTATIVSSTTLREQGASTLVQALKNSPGISMQAGEGGSGGALGDTLSIRGFNARADIFSDGVRDHGNYSRDPFNLEQVEIIKGPSAANNGRGSTGGSVNLVSKQPKAESFYAGSLGAGTDNFFRGTLDINQSLDAGNGDGIAGAALRVNAMGHSADTPDRDVVFNSRWGVAPALTLGLGGPTQATFGLFYMHERNMPDFGIPFVPLTTNPALSSYSNKVAPVPYSNFYGLDNRDYERTDTYIARMTLNHEFAEGVTLRNHTQYENNHLDSVTTAPRFINVNAGTAINHELQSYDGVTQNLTNQTDFTLISRLGGMKNTLVTGFEFSFDSLRNKARAAYTNGTSPATSAPLPSSPLPPPTDLFNPDSSASTPYAVRHSGAYTYAYANSQAAYIFDTLDLDPHWSIMGGVRYDRYDINTKSVGTTFTGNAASYLGRTDDMVGWRGAVTYKPVENGSIYVSAGNSFEPSAQILTLASTATAINSSRLGPEKSTAFEVGTKWEFFDDALLLSAAVFQTEKTNARTVNTAVPGSLITLDGTQRVRGIELGATGHLTKEWSIMAGYTYLDGEITHSNNPLEDGNALSSMPDHSGSLWTTYSFPFHLDIGAGLTYVGRRVVNTTATREVDAYVTADAMIAYHFNNHFTLRLNGYNLGDTNYVLGMYNTGSSGHVIPGPGRSAVLTLEIKY